MFQCFRHIAGRLRLLLCGITFLLSALFPFSAASQDEGTSPHLGRAFLVALPDTVTNDNAGTRITLTSQAELILYGFRSGNVTLTGPAAVRNVAISPDASVRISLYDFFLPGETPFVDVVGVPVRKSVSVVSDVPIFLYCRYVTPFGSELVAPLPVEGWGEEYRLASLRNDFPFHVGITSGGEEGLVVGQAPAQGLVIAAQNGTQVNIATATGLSTGTSFTLDAGQALLVQGQAPANNQDTAARDLTGALVTADKPIALLSGNTRSHGGGGAYQVNAPTTYNSLRNSLTEWLHPVNRLGQTFVYTPVMTEFERTEEIIRVVAVEPGVTTLTTSFGGPGIPINQGEYADLRSTAWQLNGVQTPFVLRTDKPAQAFAVTGSWGELIPDPAGTDYGGLMAWGPSMTLLPPMEEWLTVGRVPFFNYPAGVSQYVVVAAEQNAVVTLDGVVLDLATVPNSTFRWGRFRIEGPGDHTFFASGGKMAGIVYGINRGQEVYRPLRTERKDDAPQLQHIAEYEEILSIAWSAPLLGARLEADTTPDSLEIDRRDFCDSTVADVVRVVDARDIWTLGPMTAALDPGSVNVKVRIVPVAPLGPVTGYHILFEPVDPTQDAAGSVTIRATGTERRIDFTWAATMVTLPDEVDFGTDLNAGTEYRITLDLTNRKPFTATVLAAVLVQGGNGFSVDAGGRLPRALQSGRSVTVDVVFNPPAPGVERYDTLLVYTDCGVYRVPLKGKSAGEPPPVPIPRITGYDWGVRPVGSVNDTLSFAENIGTRGYRIGEIAVINDPAGVFSLAAPFHSNDSVRPAERVGVGIRFAPAGPGSFAANIRLITDDGDTAAAELLGRAVDTSNGGPPRFEIGDIGPDTVCVGDRIDTFLVVRNPGNGPIRVIAATVLRTVNADLQWPVPSGLPRTVPPGDTVRLPFVLVANGLGPFEVLLGIDSAAGTEGTLARVTGVAVECDPPALTVTDHDFGAVWITLRKEGSVTIRNVGRGDVDVLSADLLNDPENSFAYLDPAPPFIVPEGDSVVVRASFSPPTVGRKDGTILFTTAIGELRSRLTGVGTILRIPAFIRRDYHAPPGEEVEIAVELEQPADSVFPERLDLRVEFADDLLDPLGVRDEAGIEIPVIDVGAISVGLNRPPGTLLAGGPLVRLRFLTRLSLLERTELPFVLQSELPYVEFDERPGLFVIDPICGLQERLFEFTHFGLYLHGPDPNPASDRTLLELEIPFDGQTTVLLYDLVGREQLRVTDEFLSAGRYNIAIPLGTVPPGTYIVRVRSGTYAFTRRLEVIR